MILFTILLLILIILTLVIIAVVSTVGAAGIIVFGDVIVCILLIGFILYKLITKGK